MQSIFVVGAAVLIVLVILMILLAPSMRGRGYRNPAEEERYHRERQADIEREFERERRRWSPRG